MSPDAEPDDALAEVVTSDRARLRGRPRRRQCCPGAPPTRRSRWRTRRAVDGIPPVPARRGCVRPVRRRWVRPRPTARPAGMGSRLRWRPALSGVPRGGPAGWPRSRARWDGADRSPGTPRSARVRRRWLPVVALLSPGRESAGFRVRGTAGSTATCRTLTPPIPSRRGPRRPPSATRRGGSAPDRKRRTPGQPRHIACSAQVHAGRSLVTGDAASYSQGRTAAVRAMDNRFVVGGCRRP